MNQQLSAASGEGREIAAKTEYTKGLNQLSSTKAGTEDNSFPSNLPTKSTGILYASKHLQTAFKIRVVSLEIFLC